MSSILFILICLSRLLHFPRSALCDDSELSALMDLKASLDPENRVLNSWTADGAPCRGDFEGVACNELGKVANISLQGRQLLGSISSAVGRLRSLTGLYLHYNGISGEIPREIGSLSELTELYLNVNDLSGGLPEEIGNMTGLQVLQLSYNKLTGNIPTQLGLLKNLAVLNLQSNHLSGAIPASLGDLSELSWLDLSFNQFFGSIPVKLAQLVQLTVLDVQNNSLSGSVPSGFKRLGEQFRYGNNADLCGTGFPLLRTCTSADLLNPSRPEPLGAGLKPPETMNFNTRCNRTNCSPSNSSKSSVLAIVIAVTVIIFIVMVSGFVAFSWYRRKKQKIGGALTFSKRQHGADQANDSYRRTASPLISLEYSNGWDPLADDKNGFDFSQEVSQSYRFNLEEMESATQYFSSVNLLEKKSNFATTYKGILRDGNEVAIKRINKTSCKPDESEFLKGLKLLTMLRHENIVSLKGFCYSRARGECFLVYNFVENGSLSQYLDVKDEEKYKVLDWPTRVSIIRGVAKGIEYLHSNKTNKLPLVIQNLSAEKILIDRHFHPLLSGSGLHKLLADDVVFSTLKASAAMGYLAPEYATVGRFSEKSDVYAFGVLVFQILTGKRRANYLRLEAQSGKLEDLIDEKLEGRYSRQEAAKLAGIALLCTSETPNQRPMMDTILQELSSNQ